jgi:hypothetical protein
LVLLAPGLLAVPSYGQGTIRDTSIFMVPVTLSYAFQAPGGDMSIRFGANHNIGLSAGIKLPSNYVFGLEGGFLFGNKINEPGLLKGVVSVNDQVLDQDGQPATVLLYERGYTITAYAGKIIAAAGPNPNSGFLLKLGAGYMRHKIRIETQNNVVPQLEGDNLEGYDRLCAGPAMSLSFGYQYFSNNRLTNFYIGFETMVGFTEPLRAYNFDTMTRDEGRRQDGLAGLRFGWTLPIYKRRADQFYIY